MHSPQEVSLKSSNEFGLMSSQAAASISSPAFNVSLGDYKIIRRNGAVVGFEPSKISIAVTKAFLAVNGGQGAASARVRELVEQLTVNVVTALVRRRPAGGMFHIEDVQDQVELALMRSGEHDVARAYVLYRAKRMEERAQLQAARPVDTPQLHVTESGRIRPLDINEVRGLITAACVGLEKHVDADAILAETVKNLYDGVPSMRCRSSRSSRCSASATTACRSRSFTSLSSWLPAR